MEGLIISHRLLHFIYRFLPNINHIFSEIKSDSRRQARSKTPKVNPVMSMLERALRR